MYFNWILSSFKELLIDNNSKELYLKFYVEMC